MHKVVKIKKEISFTGTTFDCKITYLNYVYLIFHLTFKKNANQNV